PPPKPPPPPRANASAVNPEARAAAVAKTIMVLCNIGRTPLDATGVHSMKRAITARGRMTRLARTQTRRAKVPVRNQLQGSFAYMRHDAASWINREQDGSNEFSYEASTNAVSDERHPSSRTDNSAPEAATITPASGASLKRRYPYQ